MDKRCRAYEQTYDGKQQCIVYNQHIALSERFYEIEWDQDYKYDIEWDQYEK